MISVVDDLSILRGCYRFSAFANPYHIIVVVIQVDVPPPLFAYLYNNWIVGFPKRSMPAICSSSLLSLAYTKLEDIE